MTLTAAQQRAVRRTGQDVCVVAGPGSGKTRVLIERFAWLVEECGVAPTRILAITFTEKAATEIKERLIHRFALRQDLRESIERAWVSTIHGFCARLLLENAIAAGLPPDFSVLDQAPADSLAREAAEEVLDELFEERPGEMRRLLEALDLSTQDDGRKPDLARSLLDVLESLRTAGLSELPPHPFVGDSYGQVSDLARAALSDSTTGKTANQKLAHAKLRDWASRFLALPATPVTLDHFRMARLSINLGHLVQGTSAREAASELKNAWLPRLESQLLAEWNASLLQLLQVAVARLDGRYREKKRQESALDFADLEQEAIRLLESHDAIRHETVARFDEILMDELQDTNRLQWRLLHLIRGRLFAAGDINQSIYGFRHADPTVFAQYRESLQIAGAGIDELLENHRSRPQILEAVSRVLGRQPGIEPRELIAAKNFSPATAPVVERLVGRGEKDADVEAGLVAERIRALVNGGGYKYRDIAILVRALASAGPFERALDRFGIPFLVSGGRTFLEAREIRDLLALLAALVNPLDEIALIGVLRSPLVGLRDEEIFRIAREGWREEFDKRFGRLRPMADFLSPERLLYTALDESGYASGLPTRARANIEKLLAYVRREHHRRPRPLAELLADLEAMRATQSEAEAPPPDAGDVVRLMTVHAAKGLEFPAVFVSALHRGTDRRRPVLTFSPETGFGAKWRNPENAKGQSDPAHAAFVEALRHKEDAEENRLLYVAMTRAEDRLYLSYAERERSSAWRKLAEAGVPEMTASDRLPEPESLPAAAGAEAIAEELLDPPVVTGQQDATAAVTSIALFHECPRKYLLNSVARGQSPGASEGERGIVLGLDVHRTLAGSEADSVAAQALAERFTESELGQRAARATRVEREFDFMLSVEDVVLRGQIDLWFEEAGELILVDYKTDREESPAKYSLQLRLYALALERYAGRIPDRAVLYYLRSNRAEEVGLRPESLAEAREAIRAFSRAQDSLEFPLNAGEQCERCGFFRKQCQVKPG